MAVAGQPIEAVLTLNASDFHSQIGEATKGVTAFVNSISKSTGEIAGFRTAVTELVEQLNKATINFGKFEAEAKGIQSFNQFANGVKALATAIGTLGGDSATASVGISKIIQIVESMGSAFGSAKVNVVGLAESLRELNQMEQMNAQTSTRTNQATANLRNSYMDAKNTVMSLARAFSSERSSLLMNVQAMKQYEAGATNVKMSITNVNNSLRNMSNQYKANQLEAQTLRNALMQLDNIIIKERISFEQASATLTKNSEAMRLNAEAKLRAMGYTGQLSASESKLSASEQKVASTTNQETSSLQRQSSALSQSTARTNQLTSATSRLGKAMSSLRMMGSLVGSMLAYNFAHKLLVATGETIHAKSEMEGYFKMLNFGQRDIDGFNNALDRTVAQFQRVNKYSLGETISSIGVEFNLSTKEMEKAMKVTSMITSEYLRAGRNANEASLAVKDVLQGQFQRLSRETGVKGEQLKDAGWSGDTTDVLGLMEALEKVGKSRNWDVFAEKANSLNDILTITQNRFGEWSADLVYSVQPMIVGFFNMVMGTAQKFASVMSGIWDWLNSDNILAQITKWGSLATAITGVASAFVVYRTGANLVQVAQMGLTRTIASTVLGLKAEQVAESGLTATIFSRITGLKAEQVATMGVQRSIMTKVLGLNAEKVATMGLKGAIGEEVLARRIQEATMKGASAQQMTMIYTEYQEQMAKRGTLASIMAKIAGVNMETFAQQGLMVALAERIGIHPTILAMYGAETEAELTATQATFGLIASMTPLLAILIPVVATLGSMALALKNSADEMGRFNEIVEKGADKVKENRKTLDTYTKRQKSLQDTLAKTKQGTQEYYDTQAKLRAVNQDILTSTKNVENSYKALQRATSAQQHYDEARTDIAIHQQERIAQAYMKAGFSAEESYEMANESMRDAEAGAEQLRTTLQKLQSASNFTSGKIEEFTKQFEEAGIKDKDTIKKYTQDYLSARDMYQQGLEKSLTDDSFMGRIDGYLTMTEATIKMDLQEWTIDWDTDNPDELWKDIWTDFGQYIHPLGSFSKLIGLDDLWKGFKITDLKTPLQSIMETIVSSLQDLGKYLDGKTLMDLLGLDSNKDYIGDFFKWIGDSLASIDIVSTLTDALTGIDVIGAVFDAIFPKGVSASDGSDHPDVATEMYQVIVQPIVDWWNGFMADPLSYIGNAMQYTGIGSLISALLGSDALDFSWAWEWLNNNVILPLQTQFNMFLADPLSYIGGAIMGTGIGSLINALIPDDGGASILNYVNTSIIQPFTLGIQNGIASIPILGDIAQMLGLIPQQNPNAQDKGSQLMRAMGNAITTVIGQIPILGDILRLLGIIPQANPTASTNGQNLGDAIRTGFKNKIDGMSQLISTEMGNVVSAISDWAGKAYATAHDIGSQILNGIKNALDMHSPSIISRELIANEFGVYIPQSISNAGDIAYQTAYDYGTQIKNGISAVNTDVGFGGMVDTYETDAQIVAQSSQLMGTTTTTAFNDMSMAVNQSTSQMGNNVANTYTSIGTKQATLLNNMKTKNTTAYNEMYTKSNQSLLQMRDSTSNVTNQMTNAWNHMKNNIVASANQLKSESTSHFNQLSSTIGSFYRKIQNPSSWGSAGSPHGGSKRRNTRVGRAFSSTIRRGGYAGGRWGSSNTMTISALKHKLFPSGTGYGDMFDGFKGTDVVDVSQFLSMMMTEGHGFGGWNYSSSHYNHIKNKSDQWGMKSPTINLKGGIPTNADYKVGDFENGSPKISFSSFQSMAESIFSAIPYRFYYDSNWKGSWLGALQAGACNCWDGAHALLAFAQSCGFSGGITHGTWVDPDGTTYPHVWATINGKKMDTTAWQQRGSWSAGSPNVRSSNRVPIQNNGEHKVVNITVQFNEPVYGVDDLDSRIKDGVKEGLREEFNDPFTVKI